MTYAGNAQNLAQPDRGQTLISIADELPTVDALVEAAFMASHGLGSKGERDAMAALVNVATQKLKAVRASLDIVRAAENANV